MWQTSHFIAEKCPANQIPNSTSPPNLSAVMAMVAAKFSDKKKRLGQRNFDDVF
jgi:hypothetical protein